MGNWRLILDSPLEAAENMAIDEAVLLASEAGERALPTLRFYGWKYPSISVGYLQDAKGLSAHGLPVVRRITGGRAVLHHIELTYSLVASCEDPRFSEGITGAYRPVSECILKGLKDFGIDCDFSRPRLKRADAKKVSCFSATSRYEIFIGGKKLVGSSQRRFKRSFLQHGSIIFGVNRALLESIFGTEAAGKIACVAQEKVIPIGEFRDCLVEKFSEAFGCSFERSELSDKEKLLKERLRKDKYEKEEWNLFAREPGFKNHLERPGSLLAGQADGCR